MKMMKRWSSTGAAVALWVAAGLTFTGCSTSQSGASSGAAATAPNALSKNLSAMASGAELWAQNCGHCHNVRSPSSYSDAQWDVALLHMRVRANLTAAEHRQILTFMTSAH
jgi:hypothetical protein